MAGTGTGTGSGSSTGSASPGMPALALWLWRHPRPVGAAGRCIGQTDLSLDRRRAKRLAHRIRRAARRHGLPREVWTSPLQRCALVGRQLACWGWAHHTDTRLLELDFGHWDGLPWSAISHAEVAAWEADFAHHAPGGGESLAALARRCATFLAQRRTTVASTAAADGDAAAAAAGASVSLLVVAHAGWINASALPDPNTLQAADWAAAAGYGCLVRQRWPRAGGAATHGA
jgi:alpha-ribazole phosphatase